VVHLQLLLRSDDEEQANGIEPRGGGEDLLEVNSLTLRISFCNEACLVFDDGALLVPLHLKHQFQPNGLMTVR
jgi:hypothetical protein